MSDIIEAIVNLAAKETQRGKTPDQITRAVNLIINPTNDIGRFARSWFTATSMNPDEPKFTGFESRVLSSTQVRPPVGFTGFGVSLSEPITPGLKPITLVSKPKKDIVCPDAPKKIIPLSSLSTSPVFVDDESVDDDDFEPPTKIRRRQSSERFLSPSPEIKPTMKPKIGREFQKYRCSYIYKKGARQGQICFETHGNHLTSTRIVKIGQNVHQVCSAHSKLLHDNKNVSEDNFYGEKLISGVNCDHTNKGWKLRQPGVAGHTGHSGQGSHARTTVCDSDYDSDYDSES